MSSAFRVYSDPLHILEFYYVTGSLVFSRHFTKEKKIKEQNYYRWRVISGERRTNRGQMVCEKWSGSKLAALIQLRWWFTTGGAGKEKEETIQNNKTIWIPNHKVGETSTSIIVTTEIPVYSGNVGADVLVVAVVTQNHAELWQHRKGHKEWTGIRVVSEVPQGCCQL